MTIDPMLPPSANFGRRVFVGLTAVVATAGASIARALGDDQGLGKPHPPLVAENDPDITVERPQLPVGGQSTDAYAAYPRANNKQTPGIVIAQHVWGVDAQIRDTVRRFAKAGYVCVAPDLYAGMGAPSGDGATDYTQFAPFASKLDAKKVDAQLQAGATWIRARVGSSPLQRPPKVGVMGFCMGGKIALRAAIDDVNAFDALVMFYGAVRWDDSKNQGPISAEALAWTKNLKIPLMGQFGGRDPSILPDDVRAAQARLTVPNDIKIYPEAGHAFFDDTRERYVASAAADAWTRTLSWFSRYLR
jgi:carboxymethylenebutenolidase